MAQTMIRPTTFKCKEASILSHLQPNPQPSALTASPKGLQVPTPSHHAVAHMFLQD